MPVVYTPLHISKIRGHKLHKYLVSVRLKFWYCISSALLHFHYLIRKSYSKPLQTYHIRNYLNNLMMLNQRKCKEKYIKLRNCDSIKTGNQQHRAMQWIRIMWWLCYSLVMLQILIRNRIIVILTLDIVPSYKGYGWVRVWVRIRVRVRIRALGSQLGSR